jgi:hypothetical protein
MWVTSRPGRRKGSAPGGRRLQCEDRELRGAGGVLGFSMEKLFYGVEEAERIADEREASRD